MACYTFCFQEVRVDDYALSYQTSGRPPLPVPQEPTDEIQRKSLGLPPMFKPQTESTLAGGLPGTSSSVLATNVASSSLLSSSSQNTTTKQKIVNPADIPLGQEFKMHIIGTEKYHNIVCMPEYEGFAPEVRYVYFVRQFTLTLALGASVPCLFTRKYHFSSPNHDGAVHYSCQRSINDHFPGKHFG
jgi:hypothetical protein